MSPTLMQKNGFPSKINDIWSASKAGELEAIQILLKHGISINLGNADFVSVVLSQWAV